MRAAVLTDFGQPLRIIETTTPQLRRHEVLVRVRATGICGTDLKARDGLLPGIGLPRVLGHEIAGELVHDMDELRAGTPVACYIYDSCGHCTSCGTGNPTLCRSAIRLGLERDGGLAEYVAVPRSQLLPFAPQVPFEHAAVAMDAVATTWSALLGAGGLRSGDQVAVVGAGGLGLCAVQVARAVGAQVAVVDVNESKLRAGERAGAECAVTPDAVAGVRDWSRGGVGIALEVSGTSGGFRAAVGAVRDGGRIICCGYRFGQNICVDSADLVLRGLHIIGSRAAPISHAREALLAVERGQIVPQIDRQVPLGDINDALAALDSGDVLGRIVVDLNS